MALTLEDFLAKSYEYVVAIVGTFEEKQALVLRVLCFLAPVRGDSLSDDDP